ncbi:LamG domain-containing protein [Paenibacillus alkalitolerans]|uniref:hypothetical protein n=1 Tax=Paenibacillus alkalitolerans TaxID=2799335 RepID=UPI0018F6EB0E|nr:hypothetical protein [Paenibacillus alkalitolerans]
MVTKELDRNIDTIWIPAYKDGQEADRLIANPGSQPIRILEGMQFTDSFGIFPAFTEKEYRTPLSIEATVMTDSTNIVLLYGKGQIILNWDRREDLLNVRHPVTGKAFNVPGLGSVPTGRWHHVEWIIAEDVMRLIVNGEERYTLNGNFRGVSSSVGIRTGWRANVRVGSLSVTEHRAADRSLVTDLPADLSGFTVLPGFRSVPNDNSLLSCYLGAMRYYNRYIDEVEWLGATGLAFHAPLDNTLDFAVFSSQSKLLGIDVVRWDGSINEMDAVLSFIHESFADGVPVFGRFAGTECYQTVTAYSEHGFIVEGSDRPAKFIGSDKIGESGLDQLFSIKLTNESEKRQRFASAFRLASGMAPHIAKEYADWVGELADENNDVDVLTPSAWRKSRETVLQFIERSSDVSSGKDFNDILSTAKHCYLNVVEELSNAGREASAVMHGVLTSRETMISAVKSAAAAEEAGIKELGKLADQLYSKKLLQGLRYQGISCMSPFNTYRGIADYYGIRCSDVWLRGVTGRPFLFAMHERINVHDFCIPFPERRMIELFGNVGLEIGSMEGYSQGEGYLDLLNQAWNAAREAVDSGWACFGRAVDFSGGEYSVINGYDNDGYYTSSWHGNSVKSIPWMMYGQGQCTCEPCTLRRVNWRDEGPVRTVCRCNECQRYLHKGATLSPQEEGEVRLYWAKPNAAPDDRTAVKEALALALEFADPSGPWSQSEMIAGPSAYNTLIHALEKGRYDGWYLGLHANGWSELRHSGWQFLIEAKERIGDPPLNNIFDEAIGFAERLHKTFAGLNEMFPWMQPFGPIPDAERRYAAADLMKAAKEAEKGQLQAFEKLVGLL